MPQIPSNPFAAQGGASSATSSSLPLGANSKLMIRIKQIARYRVTGRFTDKRIAEMVGLSEAALAHLMKKPEYLEEEEALLEGRLSAIDEEIADNDDALRGRMNLAVPAALNAMLEICLQRRDLRASLTAAKEILDRDPKRRFSVARGSGPGDGDGGGAPALPTDIIASLALEGNKVVAEIRTPMASAKVSATPTVDPLADKVVGSGGEA